MDEDLGTTDWVTCPYDPNHRMKYSKFHNHFVKCQQSHPDDPREQCPYYASELIHPDNMKEHLLTCKYKYLYPEKCLEDTNLPVYDAPCHFNFDEESESDDDDIETCISVVHDDKSSLFSATTKNFKPNPRISLPRVREDYADVSSNADSSAFEFLVKDKNKNITKRIVEVVSSDTEDDTSQSIDSLNYSFGSLSYSPGSASPFSSGNTSRSSSTPSTPSSISFNQKKGFGRGLIIQKLMRSSRSSIDSIDQLPTKGLGRGALFRLRMNMS